MSSFRLLLAPTTGWILAQIIKYALDLRKDGIQLKDFYSSGGFPSSHTASTVALATYLGVVNGWTSDIFAVSAMLAAIVMYDSLGVRRAVGEHTNLLIELSKKNKLSSSLKNAKTGRGHTPFEVLGGLVLGVSIGVALALTN